MMMLRDIDIYIREVTFVVTSEYDKAVRLQEPLAIVNKSFLWGKICLKQAKAQLRNVNEFE